MGWQREVTGYTGSVPRCMGSRNDGAKLGGYASAFARIEVECATEKDASAEAERRQLLEPDPETVEWIYLRNADERWVARRVLRDGTLPAPEPPTEKSLKRKVGDFAVNLLGALPW
jgi:hypothetical protein